MADGDIPRLRTSTATLTVRVMHSKRHSLALAAIVSLIAGSIPAAEYAVGADLSFLKRAEERGTVFKDKGQPKSGLQIFKDHGYNWIRLRLFHTPTNLPN